MSAKSCYSGKLAEYLFAQTVPGKIREFVETFLNLYRVGSTNTVSCREAQENEISSVIGCCTDLANNLYKVHI